MRMTKLAAMNFKSNVKSYFALVISLAFTILVLYNFQNMIYSEIFVALGEYNSHLINTLIQMISIVLICFMFFFIWYATNVFLEKRKKEIGIYIFMGLSNQKIGKLYMIETTFIGIAALVFGLFWGIITAGLFQMIIVRLSNLDVQVSFVFTVQPIIFTVVAFLLIYLSFVIKGYCNIVRSSILNMISAMRQNEYVKQNEYMLSIKAILGIGVLGSGYYLANKEGQQVMGNAIWAMILVILGVYLLFGGLIPLLFQNMVKHKNFLYGKERCLWMNQVVFRMKKNYRTYSIVCVLGICSITALATGFAMKERYENIVLFENTYTFQVLSNRNDLEKQMTQVIEETNDILYYTGIGLVNQEQEAMMLSYSQAKKLAQSANLKFDIAELEDKEVIRLSHLTLLSGSTKQGIKEIEIRGKEYQQLETIRIPYLGYLQKQGDFYIVSDEEYESLITKESELYLYNYKVGNDSAFGETKKEIDNFALEIKAKGDYIGRVAINPDNSETEWMKLVYSICIFMFLVFVVASGCIMYMKLYNDAYEEKERYSVMCKIGLDDKVLQKSIAKEVGTAYFIPFFIMVISAYYSVLALGKMMHTELFAIYLLSVMIVLAVYGLYYGLSVRVYQKMINII